MSGYTPLFNSIITSSVWQESNHVRIVWVTLLAMSDASGKVEGSIPGLANVARVSINECSEAIEILSSPDLYSRTKEHEGRRIHAIDGGWQIYNYKKFRDKAKSRAEYYRNYRAKKRKETKEKETNTNNINYLNNTTPVQHMQQLRNSEQNQTSIELPPDIKKWNDIAFKVGLNQEEAKESYNTFGSKNWKVGTTGELITSWEQISFILIRWRNNRGKFDSKNEDFNEVLENARAKYGHQ